MKYLLDTHVLLWWYQNGPELSEEYAAILDSTEEQGEVLALSVMSMWEIAKLVQLQRIEVSFALDSWFRDLEDDPQIEVLGLNGEIILESTRLGEQMHKDQADQLIVATARCYNLRLLTHDSRIRSSGAVIVV